MPPRLQAIFFTRRSGDADAQGGSQNGAATSQAARSQERTSSDSSAITGTTARSPTGAEALSRSIGSPVIETIPRGSPLYVSSCPSGRITSNRHRQPQRQALEGGSLRGHLAAHAVVETLNLTGEPARFRRTSGKKGIKGDIEKAAWGRCCERRTSADFSAHLMSTVLCPLSIAFAA